jgi:replicative DNA helicase
MSTPVEKAVLGMAMVGADIDELASIIKPSDFYHPTHEHIWRAVLLVHEGGNTPDPMTVLAALGTVAPEARIDPTLLIDLMTGAPVSAQAPWYAERVAEAAGRRRILEASTKLHALAESETMELSEARERARQIVDDATQGAGKATTARIADILPAVIDIAENGQSPALPTGWPDLDRFITGLAPGRLVIVGARPGVGKSVMGTNLALHFAHQHKHAVLLASMEMDRTEVGQRLVAAHAGVNLSRLMNGDAAERDWENIRRRYDEIAALPLTVADEAHQTVTSIRAAARDIKRERDDLALIVVDYLQLMESGAKTANRAEEVGHISRGLKVLAREMNACVVAMAQVNREGTKHGDGRPKQSDLRESGAIEADADQIILLHRPDKALPDVEAIVDKNRHGLEGVAMLQMEGHYARLNNAAWSPSRAIA